jgi:hypothetical protein
MLEESLNFSTKLYKRKDSKWGGLTRDGLGLEGMAGNLVDGSADLIVSSLAITAVRKQFIDYLPSMTVAITSLFIHQSNDEEVSWTTYLTPFAYDLWLSLGLMAILVALVLSLISRMVG